MSKIFVNKILLENSHAHSFLCTVYASLLMLQWQSWVVQQRPHGLQSLNIFTLAFYRKSLLTPVHYHTASSKQAPWPVSQRLLREGFKQGPCECCFRGTRTLQLCVLWEAWHPPHFHLANLLGRHLWAKTWDIWNQAVREAGNDLSFPNPYHVVRCAIEVGMGVGWFVASVKLLILVVIQSKISTIKPTGWRPREGLKWRRKKAHYFNYLNFIECNSHTINSPF